MRHPRESHEPFSPFRQLGDEDGEDPHLLKRRVSRAGKARLSRQEPGARRKACQLCRQVAETLDEVLADCGDEILRGLRVTSAVPYPDASRLLVTVAAG